VYVDVSVVLFSVVTQSSVHPEPGPDRDAVGRSDAEQVFDRGHSHPPADLRVTENTRQVNSCATLDRNTSHESHGCMCGNSQQHMYGSKLSIFILWRKSV